MLYLSQLCPVLAAATGGAAAFADVAAASRAHLSAASQAQRGVRGAALLRLDQLGGAVRLVRLSWLRPLFDPALGPLDWRGLGHLPRVLLFGQRGRVLAGQLRGALTGGQDAHLGTGL